MLPRWLDDIPATEILEIAAFIQLRNKDAQENRTSTEIERLARARIAEEEEGMAGPPVLGKKRPSPAR